MNNLRKIPVPKYSGTRTKDILEVVHTDILWPFNPKAVDGQHYAIGFVDSFSSYQKVYFLKTSNDAIEKVGQFVSDIEK